MANIILAVRIPVNIDRYLPGIGRQVFPVGVIEVGIGQTKRNRRGLNIDANTVRAEILRLLKIYNNRTLVQKGTRPPKNLKKPPVFVPYFPSSENIAEAVHRLFFPFPRRFKTNLAFTKVSNLFLSATYFTTNIACGT